MAEVPSFVRLPADSDGKPVLTYLVTIGGVQYHVEGIALVNPSTGVPVDLATLLVAIGTYTDQLEGFTDGLEGYLDGVEPALSSLYTELTLKADLTDTQPVKDDFFFLEVLQEIVGAGAVANVNFVNQPHLVVMEAFAALEANEGLVARATQDGGGAAANKGIPLRHGTPSYMPVALKDWDVLIPSGLVVNAYSMRRA